MGGELNRSELVRKLKAVGISIGSAPTLAAARRHIEELSRHALEDIGLTVNECRLAREKPRRELEALLQAAEKGDVEALRTALEGADVNAVGEDQDTALHLACLYGHLEAAQELLRAGAQVNALDEDSSTPLHSAAAGGYEQIAEALIAAGADLDTVDNDGETALHQACNGEHGGEQLYYSWYRDR